MAIRKMINRFKKNGYLTAKRAQKEYDQIQRLPSRTQMLNSYGIDKNTGRSLRHPVVEEYSIKQANNVPLYGDGRIDYNTGVKHPYYGKRRNPYPDGSDGIMNVYENDIYFLDQDINSLKLRKNRLEKAGANQTDLDAFDARITAKEVEKRKLENERDFMRFDIETGGGVDALNGPYWDDTEELRKNWSQRNLFQGPELRDNQAYDIMYGPFKEDVYDYWSKLVDPKDY